ncbi:MAG TPA: MFS transporter [Bryobacteraceae bacterium]|nr:MFS transporter [Bryobacteraceae bacterium]
MHSAGVRPSASPASAWKASPRAWAITFMLFGSMTLNFIDRLVLANVAPALRSEFHLSNAQYSYIVFAFMGGMTVGQLPIGMFIDWLGARLALPGILTGWSITNGLHAFARTIGSFCSLRFIMGVFECGNYSSSVKIIGSMMPAHQRALALAIMDSGSILGSVIAPPLVVFILMHYGWHAAFLLPSVLGLLWIIPWFKIYRPELENLARPAAGSEYTEAPKVRDLLKRKQTWGVILMRGFGGPVSQFYWYWLPLYLVRGRGMSMAAMATLASVSFLIGGSGNMAGGLVSGWMITRGGTVNAARKICFTAGCLLAAATIFVPVVPGLPVSIALVAMAIFGLNFNSCNLVAIIADVFPESTLARVTGLSGIGEGVFNMILTLITGAVVDRYSYVPVFLGAGLMPLVSIAALYILVGRVEKIGVAAQAAAD